MTLFMSSDSSARASKIAGNLWILGNPDSMFPGFRKFLGRRYFLTIFEQLADFQRGVRPSPPGRDRGEPSLLLADLHLPDGDFLRYLESRGTVLPPFVVISSSNVSTVIHACLTQGALDYLMKPVDPNLLLAKIQWFIENPDPRLRWARDGLRMNPVSLVVSGRLGQRTRLTLKEFQILTLLNEAYPATVRREVFRRELWPGISVVPKTLDTHLFNLRKKLEPLGYEIRFEPDRTYLLAPVAPVASVMPPDPVTRVPPSEAGD